jgi:pimeloyl-ACP methyl ester carboxylesterase
MKEKLLLALMVLAVILTACGRGVTSPTPVDVSQSGSESPTPTETVPASPTKDPEPAATPGSQALKGQDYVPVFEADACPFQLPTGQSEGETVECGYLLVPEDRADPDSPDIHLAVAIFRHPDGASGPDPIIFLSGGPGVSPLELIRLTFEAAFAPVMAAQRDIILLDQRGVGLSQPALDCPEVTELSLELMDAELDGREVGDQERLDLLLEALLACEEELSGLADLSAYNTAANAADINDLRLALGYDQVNLWGNSYGTRLALEVMRDYPDGVRSAVLDAVYPPDVNLYLEAPDNVNRAFNVLFDNCAADPACSAAYPDLRAVFYATVERLNASPASVEITDLSTGESYPALLGGDSMLGFLFSYLYKSELLPLLPQIIYNASQDDFSLILQIQGALLVQQGAASQGMQFSVQCHDEIPFTTAEAFDERLTGYPELAPLFERSILGKLSFAVCAEWDSGQAGEMENQPIASDIPTLVLVGEYDPVAPPAWGRHAAGTLTNNFFFEYPGIGHGATSSECPRDMMIAFLNDPATEPDDACIGEMQLEFTLPTDLASVTFAPAAVESAGIQVIVPEEWFKVRDGYYISPDRTIELAFEDNQGDHDEFLRNWGASEPVLEAEANSLAWTVYPIALEDIKVAGYVATAPSESGFYMILIIGPAGKQDSLYEFILIPMLESFVVDTASIPAEAATGEEDKVKLVPYASETFGLAGLAPEGWAEVAPGMLSRGDLTTLVQQAAPGRTAADITAALLPQLGIEALPDSLGSRETTALTWDLYQIEVEVPGVGAVMVDLALAEGEGTAYLVLLQAMAEEHEALHEEVFLPAVEALAPVD